MKRTSRATAALAVLALILAACGGGKSSSGGGKGGGSEGTAKSKGGTAEVSALWYSASGAKGQPEGGFSKVTIKLDETSGKSTVSIPEEGPEATGRQWKAAAWNALTVGTILTGAPVTGQALTVQVSGQIDGPSAGALMTTATISLIKGDKLNPDVTMTGTINPDGTVGPVGGIPYKLDGVKKAGKKVFLIPAGQRNSTNDDGDTVDVVVEGQKQGITVKEVKNIYETYKEFTGKTLAGPQPGSPELDEETYQKFKAQVTSWQGEYRKAVNEIGTITPEVLAVIGDSVSSLAESADEQYARSQALSKDGQQAGAFLAAMYAAAYANSVAKLGKAFEAYLTQGADAFISQVKASASIDSQIKSFVDTLATFKPKTVADGATLMAAYGQATDAVSISVLADNLFEQAADATSTSTALGLYVTGALYYELAGTFVRGAEDVFSIGRDLGGAPIVAGLDIASVADFFRSAAQANATAFDAGIIEPAAKAEGVSNEVMQNALAEKDISYAIVLVNQRVTAQLKDYFPDPAAYAWAELGASVSLYTQTAGLIAEYYSLGDTSGSSLEPKPRSEKALNAALDLAEEQLSGVINILKTNNVNPALEAANFEVSRSDATAPNATFSDKLNALSGFWLGFVSGRAQSYLGGFPTKGLE